MKEEIENGVDRVLRSIEGENIIGSSKPYWIAFWSVVATVLLYPLFATPFYVLEMTAYFIWIFLALSLALVWGYTGIFSFGQVAFFGVGGYLFGIVAINLINVTGATNIALVSAVFGSMVFAGIVGYIMFYGEVSGVYVAVITLSITLILELALSSSTGISIGSADLGGYNGLTGIPDMTFGLSSTIFELSISEMYYFTILLLLATYFGLRYLINTDYGHVMIAVREDQDRAEMLGYDIRFIKLVTFSLGGAIAGLGGALYAAWGNFMSPSIMGLLTAALPVIWVTVGGRETLLGPILATFTLQYLEDTIASYDASFATILIGLILIAVILFASKGLIPYLNYIIQRRITDSMGGAESIRNKKENTNDQR